MTTHKPCDGDERFRCPCWERGAREEAAMHRARPATRQLTDYIRAVGDGDPALSSSEMAELAYAVFVDQPKPTPAPHPGEHHDYRMTCTRCGEPGYLFVGYHSPGETFTWSGAAIKENR